VFEATEELYRQTNQHAQFVSLESFRYCDFLLSESRPQDVVQRCQNSLRVARKNRVRPFELGLHNVILGRAYLELGEFDLAGKCLDEAVDKVREAKRDDTLPVALISRARYRQVVGRKNEAKRDLDESLETARRGEMRLHEADALLSYTRWHQEQGEFEDASTTLQVAEQMIEEMGYGRRKSEVRELKARMF